MVVIEKLKVSWSKVGKQIEELKCRVSRFPVEFSRVVGISRGGLIPAIALSHKLNLPFSVVGVSSYNDETNEQESLICDTPDVVFEGWEGNVLVIDDLTDSGTTLDFLIKKMRRNPNIKKIITATLYYKERSIIKPDIFIETTDKWVEFCWESSE